MYQGMYNTAAQIEAGHHDPLPANGEEYGEKYGYAVSLPSLRDRIALQTGQLLITMGQKLTAASLKHMHLSKDIA